MVFKPPVPRDTSFDPMAALVRGDGPYPSNFTVNFNLSKVILKIKSFLP
jgi:hypothetical protein